MACRQIIAVLRLADSNVCTLVCGGFSTDKHANYMQQLQEIHKSYLGCIRDEPWTMDIVH